MGDPAEPSGGSVAQVDVTLPETANDVQRVDRDFDAFFRSEIDRARRMAYLITRSAGAADDIAQDAMINVHHHFHRLDEPAAYLTRVVVNQCRRWHRGALSRQRITDALTSVTPGQADPVDEYLFDAVHALPYRQRVVVIARFWAGYSEAEIAQLLNCRPGTVKSLSSRALAHLRKELPQ